MGNTLQPDNDPLQATTHPFLFLQLPKQLRLLVLAKLLKFHRPVSVFRPDALLAWSLSPFPDELIALRSTSRQIKDEAEYIFISFNRFHISRLSDLSFFNSKLVELSHHSVQHLILGRDALVVTQLEEMLGYTHQAFHNIRVLAALRKFTHLQTLKITLPWEENGLSDPAFGDLIDFLVMNVRTKRLTITRPDIEFLIPGNTGHPQESSLSCRLEYSFFAAILTSHPREYQYPMKALGILSNDLTHMIRINHHSQSLGKELRVMPSRVILRLGIWLNGGMQFCNGAVWESDLDLD
ncbi:hypothetical protein MMC34_002254 [Xylographa carneopallida]|nr:hypothetical protein [Xylographa carneopallida]